MKTLISHLPALGTAGSMPIQGGVHARLLLIDMFLGFNRSLETAASSFLFPPAPAAVVVALGVYKGCERNKVDPCFRTQ